MYTEYKFDYRAE